jgi:hypothetical protein
MAAWSIPFAWLKFKVIAASTWRITHSREVAYAVGATFGLFFLCAAVLVFVFRQRRALALTIATVAVVFVGAGQSVVQTLLKDTTTQADLVAAVNSENIAGIKYALNNGADPNTEWMLNTPLAWAIESRKPLSMQLLVESGADVNAHFGLPHRTALMQAAEVGNLDAVVYLLAAGADINARNNAGRTALYHARNRSRARDPDTANKIAEYLIARGATE